VSEGGRYKMRNSLKDIENIRNIFTGTFVRLGTKNGYMGIEKTVLLKDIRDKDNKIITDHLWFNYTKGFEKANLKENDIVQFNARVSVYEKGYCGYKLDVYKPIEKDYKLSYPTKIIKIKRGE
jgi:hypothetical protein